MGNGYSATLNVKPKSMTLKREDVKVLCEIVSKAITEDSKYSHMRLTISGKQESVSARNIDELLRARWPSDVQNLSFNAEGSDKSINVRLTPDGLIGYNEILISGLDIDWVSARVRELENFIADHRNMHWVFQNWFSVVPQAILLWFLIIASMVKVFDVNKDVATGTSTLSGIVVLAIYYGLGRLYPFVFIDNGRPNIPKLIRKVIAFLLLTFFASLIGALISKWV